MEDTVRRVLGDILNEYAENAGNFGVMSKLDAIDSITLGLQPGLVYIVAAEPGAYKTALALNILENIGIENETSVTYISKFSTDDVLVTRILFQVADVNYVNRNTIDRDSHSVLALQQAGEKISTSKIRLVCNKHVMIDDIYDECADIDKPGVVIVDSLNDVSTERGIGDTLKFLKDTAVEFGIPIIATYESSLETVGKTFLMSNGADTILYLDNNVWHDTFGKDYFGDAIMLSYIELSVVRNFCGPTRKARLFIKTESLKFYNYNISI